MAHRHLPGGEVTEITTNGADDRIDALALKYLGQEKYPFRRPGAVRLILKLTPERIREIGLTER